MPSEPDHGVGVAYYDNLGEGWRIECLCGWCSLANRQMQYTGEEFDDHLKEEGIIHAAE